MTDVFARSRRVVALAVCAAVSQSVSVSAAGPGKASGAGAVAPSIADDAKADRFVEALLKRMTLEEKIGQMTQMALNGPADGATPEEHARRGEVGSFLFVMDAARINALQHEAVDHSRLHIPVIVGFDVIHGFRTIYPVPIGMAASWDPAQPERRADDGGEGGVTDRDLLDVCADAGHCTGSAMGTDDGGVRARIRTWARGWRRRRCAGFQGVKIGEKDHILACIKHFAGYGAANGGRGL